MSRTLQLLSLAFLAGPLTLPAAAQKGVHKDARIGFELKPPKEWGEVPIQVGEEWIVAKYQAPKEDLIYDKEQGGSYGHKPRLIVIAFLDEVLARADVEQDEDTGDKAETRVRTDPIYRDYAEYAEYYFKSEYGLGYYEDKAEETTQSGLPVRCLQLRCEGVGGPKLRAVTWVFETELGDVAVQLECFADKFDKYEKDFLKVVKSFRPIEHTQALGLDSGMGGFVSFFALDELSLEDRTLRRKEQESQEWAKMSADLPPGWEATELDGVRVLNHADDRHAAKVVELVKAVRLWLDDTFPQIGTGEYTRMPIVRICENQDEKNLLFSGTGGTGGTLTTCKDTDMGAESGEWGYVARRTMEMWFFDRDQMLWLYMPAWLRTGLYSVMDSATVKGKRLEVNSDWWSQLIKDYLRTKGPVEPLPARSLMTLPLQEFAEQGMQRQYDAMCLVRMLIQTRSKKYKQILPDYLTSLKEVVVEIRAEQNAKASGEKREKPKNEEEEEAYFEEQKRRAKEQESRLHEETLSRTFAGWSEGDWKDFESEYAKTK